MNLRIRELANQVERIRDLYAIGPVHRDAVEQFAELIVRECINLCDSPGAVVADSEYWRGVEVGIGTGLGITRSNIKEHFGVE